MPAPDHPMWGRVPRAGEFRQGVRPICCFSLSSWPSPNLLEPVTQDQARSAPGEQDAGQADHGAGGHVAGVVGAALNPLERHHGSQCGTRCRNFHKTRPPEIVPPPDAQVKTHTASKRPPSPVVGEAKCDRAARRGPQPTTPGRRADRGASARSSTRRTPAATVAPTEEPDSRVVARGACRAPPGRHGARLRPSARAPAPRFRLSARSGRGAARGPGRAGLWRLAIGDRDGRTRERSPSGPSRARWGPPAGPWIRASFTPPGIIGIRLRSATPAPHHRAHSVT